MAQADSAVYVQMPFWRHDGYMMGWHWGWWLLWLVIAVLVIWGLTRAAASGGERSGGRPTEDALDALRRRYAQGEISREEFEERLRVLRESL